MLFKRLLVSCLIAVLLAFSVASIAYAAPPQAWCEGNGGTWEGSDASNGTCYFEPGDVEYEASECAGGGWDYMAITFPGEDWVCGNYGDAGTGGGGLPGNPGTPGGPYGNEVHDPYETTLCLKDPKNGCVTFVGGQHVHKCAISPNLPVGAKADLPAGTVAVLYVNVVEEEGGSDTHTVCFNTEGIENPVLYQYIAGEWVRVNAGGYGGQICTTHTGDGSFALASE